MRRMTWVLAVALFYVFSVGVATQQAPAPAPAGPDMTWAFPDRVQKELPADATPNIQGAEQKRSIRTIPTSRSADAIAHHVGGGRISL